MNRTGAFKPNQRQQVNTIRVDLLACRRTAFTLTELLAVLIIVGIMAGVALPTMNNLTATRAGMAGKQILRDLTFARQRALATGTVTWVVFDTGAENWSVLAESVAVPGRAGATVLNDMATGKAYVTTLGVGDYVSVALNAANFDGAPEVGFDWLGQPLSTTGVPLTSQGSVTLSAGNQVTVEARTGHIRYVP